MRFHKAPLQQSRTTAGVHTGIDLNEKRMCCSLSVLRRPGAAAGARADGAGAAGECSGHLSSGRHALFSGLLPGQDSRY